MKIIFLNSYSPRTGHNFVSRVIKIASGAKILPYDDAEIRLSIFLKNYFEFQQKYGFNSSAKKFFDDLFLKDLGEKLIKDKGSEMIMVKDTNHIGVEYLNQTFPNELHILVLRDPRDTLISIFKGMRFFSKGRLKGYIKKIGYFTGIYSFLYSRKFSKKLSPTIPEHWEDYIIIRYEDLVKKDDKTLTLILNLFNSDIELNSFKQIISSIDVINTSFFKEETGGRHIWDKKENSEKFQPVHRTNLPFLHRKGIELGSRKFRKKLGYI